MFLIDSSVWIEFLRSDGSQNIKGIVHDLIEKDKVSTCGVIVVEILRGARNKKDFDALSETFNSIPQIPLDSEVIERAAMWGFSMDRKGYQVPTTDLFIASAAYKRVKILHIDQDFEVISSFFDLEQEKLER